MARDVAGAEALNRGLAKLVPGAGDQDTGAAGFAIDAVVTGSWRAVIVVAREELALVDPKFAIQEVEFLHRHVYAAGNLRRAQVAPAC